MITTFIIIVLMLTFIDLLSKNDRVDKFINENIINNNHIFSFLKKINNQDSPIKFNKKENPNKNKYQKKNPKKNPQYVLKKKKSANKLTSIQKTPPNTQNTASNAASNSASNSTSNSTSNSASNSTYNTTPKAHNAASNVPHNEIKRNKKVSFNEKNIRTNKFDIKKILNSHEFVSIKFNNDYRDVYSLINNMNLSNGKNFNIQNLPVRYTVEKKDKIINLINHFIYLFNDQINKLPQFLNHNSLWNEPLVEKSVESGWNKFRLSIGLNESLYDKPAQKNNIKLIDILEVHKYKTRKEIKYEIKLLVSKKNVNDKAIINTVFIKNITDPYIYIEDISINGFLIQKDNIEINEYNNINETFYNFNELNKNSFVDTSIISNELLKRQNMRHKLNENWINNLDLNDKEPKILK